VTVTLRPMPEDRLDDWIAHSTATYLEERMESGESREVAEARVAQSMRENFPNGRPLPSHRLFDVMKGEDPVGQLWIGPQVDGSASWWVYDIEIFEPYRRRGFARAALELGHAEAKALGGTSIGLNVFGFNTGARELYEKLGYAVTSTQMKRQL
jgi:GNAT superfamily N-acetyltransferase